METNKQTTAASQFIAPPDNSSNPGGLDETALPKVTPYQGFSEQMGEGEAGIKPDWWGKFGTSVQQLSERLPIGIPGVGADAPGAWVRAVSDWAMEREQGFAGKSKITAQEANTRYPGLPIPFSEPIYPEIAQHRYDEFERRKTQQEWIDRGPKTGFGFDAAVGAFSMFDPIYALTNIATGAAFSGAKVLNPVTGILESQTSNFGKILVENAVGNLAADIPSYLQERSEGQVSSLEDTVTGAITGAALGAGLNKVLHSVYERFRSTPESVREKITREAISQHESANRVNTASTGVTQTIRRFGLTDINGRESSYRYYPSEHPSDNVHYQAINDKGSQVPFAEEMGLDGLHAVNNPDTANNSLGGLESRYDGKIKEMNISHDAKMINIDDLISDKEIKPIADSLIEKYGLKDIPSDATIRDVFKNISSQEGTGDLPSGTMRSLKDELIAKGYDGFKYTEKLGNEPLHDGVYMFNDSKVTSGQTMTGNREVVPMMNGAERSFREKLESEPVNYKNYDPITEKELKDYATTGELKPEEIDPILDHQYEQSQNILKEFKEEDPEAAEILQEHKRLEATEKQEANAIGEMINCKMKDPS